MKKIKVIVTANDELKGDEIKVFDSNGELIVHLTRKVEGRIPTAGGESITSTDWNVRVNLEKVDYHFKDNNQSIKKILN